MGILFNILAFPVMGPIKGMKWIAEKVDDAVQQTVSNKGKIKEDLLELQMQLEMGKITEEEFNRQERELLEKLDRLSKEEKKRNE
jgi:hypothetical protein